MRGKSIFPIIAIIGFLGALGACALDQTASGDADDITEAERRASDPRNKNYRAGDIYSGYVAMTSQTRDMQDARGMHDARHARDMRAIRTDTCDGHGLDQHV